ncbi:hydrophobic protein [Kitasatospora sp. NPDC058190]
MLAIILGGVGFAVHALWWIALAVPVLWTLGFVLAEGGGRRYRW